VRFGTAASARRMSKRTTAAPVAEGLCCHGGSVLLLTQCGAADTAARSPQRCLDTEGVRANDSSSSCRCAARQRSNGMAQLLAAADSSQTRDKPR
jgi:hypothetical protein